MKTLCSIIYGVLSLSLTVGEAQERGMEVKSTPDLPLQCTRAESKLCVWEGESHALITFFADEMRRANYNDARVQLGGEPIQSKSLNDDDTRQGLWAIVIDDSDSQGRQHVIRKEIQTAGWLISGMSPGSKVGVFSLARDLKLVGRSSLKNTAWVPRGKEDCPVINVGAGEAGDYSVKECFPEWFGANAKIPSGSTKSNTNLWSGLLSLISYHLPAQRKDDFAHMPANIIVFSDGVDESGRPGDLDLLMKTAREANVHIHTVAFPLKDPQSSGKISVQDRQKGYNDLSRLSQETGGVYCGVDANTLQPDDDFAACTMMLRQGEKRPMVLDFSPGELKPNSELVLSLKNGENMVGQFTISPFDMNCLYVEWLENRIPTIVKNAKSREDLSPLAVMLKSILFMEAADKVVQTSALSDGLKSRLLNIIRHWQEHPGLARTDDVYVELVLCLCQPDKPLPVPEATNTSPTVVNVSNSSPDSSGEAEEREGVQDWVWWSLGVGSLSLCVMGFWLVVRLTSRSKPEPVVTIVPGGPDLSAPTQPVIASLVNAKNPAQSWVVCKIPCRVGRHSSNDVSMPFSYMSGTQFILTKNASGQWELRDANSTNGTMVNGRKVKDTLLNSGDLIRVAELELEFKAR